MFEKTSLIERSQSIDGALEHAHPLHNIVDIEILLDLTFAFGEDSSELGSFAEDDTNDCFKDKCSAIAAVFSHVDSLLGDLLGFGK